MTNFILSFILLLPLKVWAFELKVGDILLQPLDCWSCRLIEEQEQSIYSHVGMVIEVGDKVKVIEALGKVRTLSLDEFNARTQKDQKLSVRRFQNEKAVNYIQDHKEEFILYYQKNFEGLKYDHDFLWNNFDENGYEKIYCSELITKLISGFMGIELPRKYMKFDKNRDLWIRYFRGNPPDGQWGNSPADLERSELLYEVGEI
jgi:hypothetical protein